MLNSIAFYVRQVTVSASRDGIVPDRNNINILHIIFTDAIRNAFRLYLLICRSDKRFWISSDIGGG